MRLKKIMVLSGLICCALIYIEIQREIPCYSASADVLQNVQHIVNKSGRFTDTVQEMKEKKVYKVQSDVVIEGENEVLSVAKRISMYNRTVLVTIVNNAYLPFTYSWLCNTKNMDIHRSVLIITSDDTSKKNLTKDWPALGVVSIDMGSKGDQTYSKVGYVKIMVKRTEIILSIVMANIEVFLFEVDCLWLSNPVPQLQKITGYDILVNPVGKTKKSYAGGFLWLYPTDKTKALWKQLREEMIALGKRISQKSDNAAVSQADNDQQYFSRLIHKRYMGVKVKVLPLEKYADGQWYKLSEAERKKSHPVVINNNWVVGNKAKKDRAKKWKHWFIHDDFTCDMEQVNKTVY